MTARAIAGVGQFTFNPHVDERGVFQRIWDRNTAESLGMSDVVQVSISMNPVMSTLRGLHMLQLEEQEIKSICCVTGKIQDVLVDMRSDSATYMQHMSIPLEAGMGVVIPPGVAHGYLTLTSDVTVAYGMSSAYRFEKEVGFNWKDPRLGISWNDKPKIISLKDDSFPFLS